MGVMPIKTFTKQEAKNYQEKIDPKPVTSSPILLNLRVYNLITRCLSLATEGDLPHKWRVPYGFSTLHALPLYFYRPEHITRR